MKNRLWLLTNGLGSYSTGSTNESNCQEEYAVFTALLRPPLRREMCVRRMHETVYLEDGWRPLTGHAGAGGAPAFASKFALVNNLPVYKYTCDRFVIRKCIYMEPDAHALYIQYHIVRAATKCRLRVHPLLILPPSYFNADHNESPLHLDKNGFAFNFELSIGRKLYVSSDVASKVIVVNNWMATIFGQTPDYKTEVNYIPAALSLVLKGGERATIRIGLNAVGRFDADIVYAQAITEFLKKGEKADSSFSEKKINQVKCKPHDFIIERASANSLCNTTILAGYPGQTDDGRSMLLALPGLLLVTGEFERAQSILEMLKANAYKKQIPCQFSDQPVPPTYTGADVTLWYFVAIYEYWQASRDRDFIERIFSFLLQLLMEMISGTESGVKLDAQDGLLEMRPDADATTWMDAKVGNWPVTPRFGKPVEIQALWYNALKIMLAFSEVLDKGSGAEKLRGLLETADKNIKRFFWLSKAGYLADVLTPEGLDSSFRANQAIALGLPFTPFPAGEARAVLDKVAMQLVTPFGLRTLSPFHAAYRGTIGSTDEEKAGAWHNGTVHPWLVWPYVRAALRNGYHPQKIYEIFQPLFETVRSGILGHISEAFEGDAPHKPVGAGASAVSLGAAIQCFAELKRDVREGSRVKVSLPI